MIVYSSPEQEQFAKDTTAIREIVARQGVSFLIEEIAEQVAAVAANYKLTHDEAMLAADNIVNELNEAIGDKF